MKIAEKEIAEILLKEIKEASSKPETLGDRSPREKAVSNYREFIQAAATRSNINQCGWPPNARTQGLAD